MDDHDGRIQRIRAAAIDGRTENIRYRQGQLQNLHAALREQYDVLRESMLRDAPMSVSEIDAELFLSMATIKEFYDSLDFEKELEQEYLIAHSKNNSERRVGYGSVLIRPISYTRLYSVISPLVAAISAGNCVVIEMEDTLSSVDQVVKAVLSKSLDHDTFYVCNKVVQNQAFLDASLVVDQRDPHPNSNKLQLLSSTKLPVIAIVDRTADVDNAAKCLVGARFGFGGSSPYAPDLVIVNEFVKRDFFEGCTKYASKAFAEGASKRLASDAVESTKKAVKDAESKGHVTSFGSANFMLVDVQDRNCTLLNSKVGGRTLPIVSCSSIVDAVELAQSKETLLATYIFAAPPTAKFLGQQLDAYISLVNHIPTQLLIGPATPIAQSSPYPQRYSKEMFSKPRPQFIVPPLTASKVVETLQDITTVSSQQLKTIATTPLKPTGQGKGFAIGFFEQGILAGACVVLGVVFPAVGYGTYVLGRKFFEFSIKR